MPKIGFGIYLVKDLENVIQNAIKLGYRHIDTAPVYKNEKECGDVIQKVLANKLATRDELYISTKVWNNQKHDPEESLRASLANLKLDYVDLFLVHWPFGEYDNETNTYKHYPLHKTWSAMEECVKKGLCKAIGVSNFNVQLLLDLLSYAQIKPVCNQVEIHPYLTQDGLVNFCIKNGVQIIAYSPLCRVRDIGGRDILNEPLITSLAAKYSKSESQIVLNWHLSRGYAIIPKASSEKHLLENLSCHEFIIDKHDLDQISNLNKNYRSVDPKNRKEFGYIPLFD